MPGVKRNPYSLVFITAAAILAGCGYFSTADTPRVYTQVTTFTETLDIGEPFGISVKEGVTYVADGDRGTILQIAGDGPATTIASGLNTPSGIAFTPSGELIVADTGSNTIRKISSEGAVSILAGVEGLRGATDGPTTSATFNGPIGVAVDAEGAIYVSDTYNDRIRMIRDGVVTTVAGGVRGFSDGVGTSASFDTPLGIAMHGETLLVADSGNARIRLLEKNGVVTTLSGGNERDLIDGTLSSARFVEPTAITVDDLGAIFVADGNAIRLIGRRALPMVETFAGGQRGFRSGESQNARFNRPSGLAIGKSHELYVADSDNRAIRIISSGQIGRDQPPVTGESPLPLATRWPFEPPSNPRDVAGTLGEIRGDLKPDGKPVWFHNGLDIAGAYGETTKFIRDETVLDPRAAENFGTSRELLRLPLIGYIHLRLGRDKDNIVFDDPRFQFDLDATGKLSDVRVPRGSRFNAGEVIGTLNAMNHVHLIAGRIGHEINALAALQLPGIRDSIPPTIEKITLYDSAWSEIDVRSSLPDKVRIVVSAYDRMDGNSDRRRLGVYRVGFQLLSNGTAVGDPEWRISFERSPSNDEVRLAYANGSKSGYTPETVFGYIATNYVDGDDAHEAFLDTTSLARGRYTIRVFVADYFGNVASRDVEVGR